MFKSARVARVDGLPVGPVVELVVKDVPIFGIEGLNGLCWAGACMERGDVAAGRLERSSGNTGVEACSADKGLRGELRDDDRRRRNPGQYPKG